MIRPILEGTKEKGHGAASDPRNPYSLPAPLPIFEKQYDELRGTFRGTINVNVHKAFDLKIDFRTFPHRFGSEVHCVEFIRVLFEYPLEKKVNAKAWIYQPYGYHWTQRAKTGKFIVEVLVGNDLGLIPVDAKCRIHVLNYNEGEMSTSTHYLNKHGPHLIPK